jgi:hypothetical protein
MSAKLEIALARLYADADSLSQFWREPETFFDSLALTESDRIALRNIDRVGLRMAAKSYANKRGARKQT